MKSLKYTLVVSLLTILWPDTSAYACWGPWYLPKGYYMYRVVNNTEEDGSVFSQFNLNTESNCREWQRYSSPNIPLMDIYQVVYKMSLEDFEAFHNKPWNCGGNNAFLRWLSLGKWDEMDFLLFAKTTEDIRNRQNSRWYYPSMRSGAKMTLEEIVELALDYHGPLRDRYLLQAVRAMFSLRRYAECAALWDNEARFLPQESAMRQLILPYIAGAEYRMKNYGKAVAYFYEAGDFASMIACSDADKPTSTVEAIERIYQYEPNCRHFPKMLQQLVHTAEPIGEYYWEEGDKDLIKDEHRQLARLAVRIAREGRTDNPAMWYYTAAFIEDLDGRPAEASRWLARAEQSRGTEFIKESVKVMRIYLDAKLNPYNQTYENRLLGQLQWLDQKIANNITPTVREQTSRNGNMRYNISYYYWNDMMRRIVLAEVCPRMIAADKPVRALQLANMADNRLLGLVDCKTYDKETHVKGRVEWVEVTCTMREFRRDKDAWSPDYSNSFFEMIDSFGVDKAIAYRNRIERPLDTFDRFLNERGYADMEYINDIVGTQCLRTMRYGDAVTYLGKIGRSFEGHLNTEIYWDPFSYEPRDIKDKSDFKYRFAREMCMLEQEMNKTTDPDRKAEAMICYATGMRNSFDRCWQLTQYYRGTSYWGQVQEKRDWETEPEAIRAMERSTELFKTACALFTDRELAAKALYEIHLFRTVAEKYPETEMGQYLRGHCDGLRDYMPKPEC